MKKCINCIYFGSCQIASEEIKECEKFKKRGYDTKLIKVDGLNYKFERIRK